MRKHLFVILTLILLSSCKDQNSGSKENTSRDEDSTESIRSRDTLTQLLRVSNPNTDQVITSPLKLQGSARGYWFFEAEATVELLDEHYQKVAQTNITATSEWMTEDWAKFSGTLSFIKPPTEKGFLVFHKANPSGMEEHNQSDTIPVKFN